MAHPGSPLSLFLGFCLRIFLNVTKVTNGLLFSLEDMLDETRASVWARLKAVKPPFMSKKPHFNFISVHYTWIIGATLLASVIIYGAGRGQTSYVDSLMFASGANTQAGLNPIDVNLLNTFQQIVVYLFTITSNPITLHTSVVFLRLYWFEKRFQGWVTDARQRRATLSKAKTRPRNEREAEEGVNGRHITVVPYQGRPPRITNDGILLDGNDVIQSQAIADDDDDENLPHKPPPASSDESDTVSAGRSNSIELSPLEKPDQGFGDGREANEGQSRSQNAPTGIKFAETVKRSDGVDDDLTKFPQRRSHAEHIAILERQRNQDNEILRIPGPRETERGMGPRRLDNDDTQDGDDDNNTIAMTRTVESRPDHATLDSRAPTGRRPTIVIAEPKRPLKHELTDDAKAVGGTLNALRVRKPRVFNRGQKEVHDDNESTMGRAFRTRTIDTIKSALSNDHTKDMPYLSYTPTMGRNSNFVGLTLEQREELGGIEYRSLRTLALILLSYFWGFQLIAVTFLLPFILHNEKYGRIVEGNAISRTWWGFWTANSGRSNSIELSPLEKPDQGFGDGREANEGQSRSQNAPTGIKFAETVKRSDGVDDDLTKFPQRRSHAEHIAILERQRNQDNEILRIPGPRETERGMGPRRLDNDDTQDGDDDNNTIAMTRTVESRPDHATLDSRAPTGRRPTIVIAEPKRPLKHELTDDAKAVGGTLNALRVRKPRVFNRGQKEVHDDNESTMGRAFRTRTIDTIKSALSNDHTKDMPYLSYTPTMGRNSNFVGLTLEQREELGGIEYRSLRTLALILLSYFWGFQLIAVTFLLPFILHNEKYGRIVEGNAISRTWWGFWTANSAL
ncbi:Low-affinity potassium transport protein [Fusarium odoratissimum]|uniref:Low-affinity potassium transport protein n=1 Tax=Fusarium oxysporum f. sp. cubense (strain race 4) TaxID=2502994 RepID=N1RHU4_FUSC4|nr:Low-affinity potassium transport protein [Fusarium odoratissimum]